MERVLAESAGADADDPFFAGRKIEEREGCGGRWVFPIRYYESTMIGAHFPAPVAAVQKILPTPALKPAQLMPDVAVVILMAFEYRHIDQLAPYNEFMVAVPVVYKTPDHGLELPGAYVFRLPVTTEEARCVGVEFYGFPKFLAEITFEEASESRRCRVRAEGQDIISLDVKSADTKKTQLPDFYSYTVKNGQLVRTRTQAQAQLSIADAKGGASVALGNHRVAEQLRALEMDQASARHLYATHGQFMLPCLVSGYPFDRITRRHAVPSAPGLAAAEYGRLRQDDGGHGWAGRRRRVPVVLMLQHQFAVDREVCMGTSLKDQLLGSWRLDSFYLQKEAGEPIYWWGHDIVGRLTFDEKGRFAAQVGRRDRQPLKSERLIDVTPDEAREAFLGYLAYFGTYMVDEEKGTFTTRVEGSLVPNWAGTEQERWATVDGDRAVFTAAAVPSPMGALTPTLVWRRLS